MNHDTSKTSRTVAPLDAKAEVTYSPRLRGAHRYTTRGGMCALRGASFTCNGTD